MLWFVSRVHLHHLIPPLPLHLRQKFQGYLWQVVQSQSAICRTFAAGHFPSLLSLCIIINIPHLSRSSRRLSKNLSMGSLSSRIITHPSDSAGSVDQVLNVYSELNSISEEGALLYYSLETLSPVHSNI